MPVKKNHKTLFKKLSCFFENSASATLFEAQFREGEEVTVARGRHEVRTLKVSSSMPQKYTGFAGVRQVFRLTRKVTYRKTKQVSEETLYGITNLSEDKVTIEGLLALMRGHWTSDA
jgi:hypothetical protein